MFGVERTFCEGCRPAVVPRGQVQAYWMVIVLTLLGILTLAAYKDGRSLGIGLFLVFVAALLAGSFLTTIVHELGHAFAVWITDGVVVSVCVGSGPVVLRWRMGATIMEVRAHFRGGGGVVHYSFKPAKWKKACILLGGVAANAVAAAMLLMLVALTDDANWSPLFETVVLGLAASQLLAAILNLVRRNAAGSLPSDGQQLRRLLVSKTFQEDQIRSAVLLKASALVRDGRCNEGKALAQKAWSLRPSDGLLFSMLVHCTGRTEGPAAAVQTYLDHLPSLPAPGQIADAGWAYAYGNVAWHALMAGNAEWREMADALAARATEVIPQVPAIMATRGAALIVAGDVDAGFPLVITAVRQLEPDADKAEFCAFLGAQEEARGNHDIGAEFVRLKHHVLASVRGDSPGMAQAASAS